jgi:ferrochelatase
LHAGGKTFHYIPCLNDEPIWINALTSICEQHLQGWPTASKTASEQVSASAQLRERALALGAKD